MQGSLEPNHEADCGLSRPNIHPMNEFDKAGDAICILSLDSGGPGTYSQLLIIKEYMSRLANDLDVAEEDLYPGDYFDLISGVGFGGLVAIMLGHLRMNLEEALDTLIAVATRVFPEEPQWVIDPDTNSRRLKDAIEDMLQTKGIPVDDKMYGQSRPQTRCKVAIYAATSSNISHPQAFRTYPVRGASLNPTIVEAVCATMAVPSYFLPVKIGRSQQSFVGGALGANNPTRVLLKEASIIFGSEKRVAQIISVGCGVPQVLSLEAMTSETGADRLLKEIPTDCQMVAKELAARLYNIDAYLRLSVESGIGNIAMHEWSILGDIEMHTSCYLEAHTVTRALEVSLKRLQKRAGMVTLGHLNQSSSIKIAAKKPPSVSPYFVLRNKEWEKLVSHLVTLPCPRQRILPITGMGGCGKTQLVSYFLQEYPALFKQVVYVDASTMCNIEADLQTWVRTLGDGHERDVWEDAVRILASTPEDERWGLIFDNADDPALNLGSVLPKSVNLAVIITSRNRTLGNLSTTYHMELGEMEPEEALAALLHAARRYLPLSSVELASAKNILKELGCLAVALVQAGTYCHELSCSFAQYLSLFYSHRAELMKKAEPSSLDNYQRGAYTTLDLSYNALPHPCREFLRFVSFFYHTDIPLVALSTAAEYDFEDPFTGFPRPDEHASVITDLKTLLCADGKWSEMRVQEILRSLQSFSLLSISSIEDVIYLQLHPLIQSWSRDMDHSISQHHRAMACQVLTACSRDEAFLPRHLLPHIISMVGQLKGENMHIVDLMSAGKLLQLQGHYGAAETLFKTVREAIKMTTNRRENDLTTISAWLASIYWAQGRWSEAEELGVEVLQRRKQIFGTEHPDTIAAAHHLAVTYQSQGRWVEAEKVGAGALEQRRRVLGNEHPNTIRSAAVLGSIYRGLGQWIEAEKLLVETLDQCKNVLGREHPDTQKVAENLAWTYHCQDRWSEAEELQTEALELRRKVLGTEHPDTILAAEGLAGMYIKQNRWGEASTLFAPIVQRHLEAHGQRHPESQEYLRGLMVLYRKAGKEKEAQETSDLLIS